MSVRSRISKAFDAALHLPLNDASHYVIFSDCHRGTGKINDNFLKNETIYLSALKYYFSNNYTYIELGDGDELWENSSFEAIKESHPRTFHMLSQFYNQQRFYSVYGNHDIIKSKPEFCQKHFNTYYCDSSLCCMPLFPNIEFYSGIILEDEKNKMNIYLTHGHQSSLLNSTFWPVARFLVRYLWKPLEFLGIPDPTSAAKSNIAKSNAEKHLSSWACNRGHILITGHTHRPIKGTSKVPYFNTGSCVSPGGITCIEINGRCVSLIKWLLGTNDDLEIFVEREVLGDTCFVLK